MCWGVVMVVCRCARREGRGDGVKGWGAARDANTLLDAAAPA